MFQIDRNWQPSAEAVRAGRGTGRTTRMMLKAIELAWEPQTIVMLFPTEDMAAWARHWFMNVLSNDVPHGAWNYVRSKGNRIEVFLSEVFIIPVFTPPGRFLARGVHCISIMADHTIDDRPAIYRRETDEWLQTINLVQRLNESRDTIDALRVELLTSRT